MHLMCLGVMKKLLLLWIRGLLKCRLGPQANLRLSGALLSLGSYIPKEFARKPRVMDTVERWKTTEFRLFLLYTGPIALAGRVAKEMYNFMLLMDDPTILQLVMLIA